MINESLHTNLELNKGDFFIEYGQKNYRIAKILKGVLRGFTINNAGDEVTTHFFMETDLVSGNYIPNVPSTLNIQVVEACLLSVADYTEIFSHLNKDTELTNIILSNFQVINKQNSARVATLITGNAITKYTWFLNQYPNLLNRVPHYYIANFLGMTATQLSRTRKLFSQQM